VIYTAAYRQVTTTWDQYDSSSGYIKFSRSGYFYNISFIIHLIHEFEKNTFT
jgi:hypothetical protein